jgi:hypothetical protein
MYTISADPRADIIVVLAGPEEGTYIRPGHEARLRDFLSFWQYDNVAVGRDCLLGHTYKGTATTDQWDKLLALVIAGHAERTFL